MENVVLQLASSQDLWEVIFVGVLFKPKRKQYPRRKIPEYYF